MWTITCFHRTFHSQDRNWQLVQRYDIFAEDHCHIISDGVNSWYLQETPRGNAGISFGSVDAEQLETMRDGLSIIKTCKRIVRQAACRYLRVQRFSPNVDQLTLFLFFFYFSYSVQCPSWLETMEPFSIWFTLGWIYSMMSVSGRYSCICAFSRNS